MALAERDAYGDWRRLSWRNVRAAVGCIAQSLLGLNLPGRKPVVILSDNSIDHALLMLAAMHIGRPVCSVSSAYCRLTQDYTKINGIVQALDPGLIYAADAGAYGPALAACDVDAVKVLGRGAEGAPGALSFETLLQTTEGPAVMRAFDAVVGDDHAKYLLTSGSTGHPKVVINTHRMLCANQQMIAQAWRFLDNEKPVLLDWLPWSHTFGGNHNLNRVLRNGGTLYIDEGRPAPGLIEHSVRNLREVRPNLLFNVPRGLDMLLPFLESDRELARDVFSRLRMVFCAAAALPSITWKRLEAVAAQVRDEPFKLTTGTWVSVGTLRLKLVSAFSPFAQDVAITGHDRDEIGAMVFPSAACAQVPAATVAAKIREALCGLRAEGGGSSQRPVRALMLIEPPSADAGKITDKGYINQRAVLTRRAAEVDILHGQPPNPRVIHAF